MMELQVTCDWNTLEMISMANRPPSVLEIVLYLHLRIMDVRSIDVRLWAFFGSDK